MVRSAWCVVRSAWLESNTSCTMARCIFHKLQATSHESRTATTGHKLQATCRSFSTPRTRPSCRPRSGVHAARTTKTLSPSSNSSRVAHYGPSRHHHVPRTTYPRADTWFRPYDEINASRVTSHDYRPRAAGHLPLFSSFQPSELLGSRELESRPARSPSLVDAIRNNGDDGEPQTRLLKRPWTPAFAGVTRGDPRGVGGE